jgi:outer membrane protein, heavy metal efflux system
MSFSFRAPMGARSLLVVMIATSYLALPVAAQSTATAPTGVIASTASISIAEAFQLALAQQPWTLAASERQRELQSREALADSWLADSPTIASGLKAGNRESARELEVEISAPIATASRRSLQLASVRGESSVYNANLAQLSLKLAGEVRDAYWAVQLAASELALADDEVRRAEAIATDSARRTAAGDSARVDTLQAELNLQTLRSTRVEVEQRLLAARQVLRGLIGDSASRGLSDRAEARDGSAQQVRDEHPALLLANQSSQLARAKLSEAAGLTNGAPTVSFALTNERSNTGGNASTARIGISVPFGGSHRAAPRIAQAGAELAEAQANIPLLRRHLQAEAASAQAAVTSAERRISVLTERERLANEVATLYAKAYRLGELDLPTRLRAEGERANANLALSRAHIEHKHAISRANQALGLLP